MALETATPPATPSARVVGNAFVEQYYHILYNTPELAHGFYHDSSVLSWPDSNGVMTSVTTMQGINEKILSLNFKNYKAEINIADAQKSYKEGVTVLVTGCRTGKDNLKRKFAQSFFLAPQDNGYFVLNDVLKYVEDSESPENQKVNAVYDALRVPSAAEHEPTQDVNPSATDAITALVEENQNVAEQVYDPSDQEKQLVNEKEALSAPQSHSNSNDTPVVVESASSAQEDATKKSYASISVKEPIGETSLNRSHFQFIGAEWLCGEASPPLQPVDPKPTQQMAPNAEMMTFLTTQFEGLGTRMDTRFDAMNAHFNSCFDTMDTRLTSLESRNLSMRLTLEALRDLWRLHNAPTNGNDEEDGSEDGENDGDGEE